MHCINYENLPFSLISDPMAQSSLLPSVGQSNKNITKIKGDIKGLKYCM